MKRQILTVATVFMLASAFTVLVFATTIFEDGFESGDFSAWTGTLIDPASTLAVETEQKHHGTYAAHSTAAAWQSAICYRTDSGYNTVFLRFYFYMVTMPTSGTKADIGHIGLYGYSYADMRVRLFNDAGTYKLGYYRAFPADAEVFAEVTIATNEWHCVEAKFVKDAANGEYKVWYDGNLIVSETGLDTSGAHPPDTRTVGCMAQGSAVEAWFDCVVVADIYIGPEEEAQEYSYTFAETLNATATLNQQQEQQQTFSELIVETAGLQYSGEGIFHFSETETATETINYWLELQYIYTETMQPISTFSYAIEGIQEFYETFVETMQISDTMNYWTELAEVFLEYSEVLTPQATLTYAIQQIGGISTGVVSTSFVIIALAMAFAALALILKRQQEEGENA